MNLYWRLLLLWLTLRRRGPVDVFDVGRTPLRVYPRDLDQLGHVNNGVYLTMADLGRWDLMKRSGAWPRMRARGWAPVVGAATVTFRRSLKAPQLFVIESRILGVDDRAVFIEQRFVVHGEIWARLVVRARFVKRTGGTVTVAELAELLGFEPAAHPVPDWAARWADDVALPSTRRDAPSTWD